jgi:magnesium-protoporphyrin IX monomethyl ester (oxidative) cyclase
VVAEAEKLLADKPAIIGFSSSFQQNCASLAIAAQIKVMAPDVLICFGGANADSIMGKALLDNFAQVDMVFSGDSDRTFPEFVVKYLEKPGGVPLNAFRKGKPVTDLDALPIPDFTDYFDQVATSSFAGRLRPALVFESSRGCWWGEKRHCAFCGLNGDGLGFRAKSPQRVVDEITTLHRTWGISRFAAADNIMDMRHVNSIFNDHRDTLKNFRFFYEIKANLTKKHMKTLARGGVVGVQPGIESLNDDILKKMKKGVDSLHNIMLLRVARELGISVAWNILTGLPGEHGDHIKSIAAIVPRLQHLERPTGMARVLIVRFSPYHDNPIGLGFLEPVPAAAYAHIYDLPDKELARFAFFFTADRQDGLDIMDYCQPLADLMARWHERANTPNDRARLAFCSLGPLVGVEDTRDMAIERFYMLDEAEKAILKAFDTPRSVAETIENLAETWPHIEHPDTVFKTLDNLGYLVQYGTKAISVVTDPSLRIIPPTGLEGTPSGVLMPPNHNV